MSASIDKSPSRPFQIVVGYDFSEQADLALDQAMALAQRDGQTIVHVIGVLSSSSGSDLSRSRGQIDYQEAAALQQRIEGVVSNAAPTTAQILVHVRIGRPAREILTLAGEARADLVLIGTHGRTGLRRLTLGSVAESIVRRATCPVLVMRQPDYEEQIAADEEGAGAPEPACPTCEQRRSETGGAQWWCEEHGKPYLPPRRYGSTDTRATVPVRPAEWQLW